MVLRGVVLRGRVLPHGDSLWTNSTPGGTTLYWSYLSCDIADVDPVAAAALLDEDPEDQVCKWEPEVSCECTGSNSGFPFDEAPLYNNASLFPADYGTSCTAWELDECAAMWPSVDDLGVVLRQLVLRRQVAARTRCDHGQTRTCGGRGKRATPRLTSWTRANSSTTTSASPQTPPRPRALSASSVSRREPTTVAK